MTTRHLFLLSPLALLALLAILLARPAPIGVLRPSDLPIALRGTQPEPELSERLAERAEAARHDGVRGDYVWEECVDAVGVLSLDLPPDADDAWRGRIVDAWAGANHWDHGLYKEGGDALFSRVTDRYQFKVLALPAQPQYLDPLERALAEENPDKLLVFAMSLECPDPDPRWKVAARSALSWIGLR